MTPCDTLICPQWVLPVRPEGAVLRDHAIALDAGRIVAVLPVDQAVGVYQPRQRIDRPGHAVIPGLVNAHTHAAMTLLRGYAEDLPLDRWLTEAIWPAEGRIAGREMVVDGTRLAVAEMLRGGATTFADMYLFPDACAEVASEAGMRVCIGLPIIDFPTAWAADSDEYFSRATDVADRFRTDALVTTQFAPHSAYAVSPESLKRTRVLADQLDARVHVHLHETEAEIDECMSRFGKRPIEVLADAGLVNGGLSAAHAVHVTDADLETIARAGVALVHCPESNAKLASGMADVPRMLAAGVTVALGTDGAASNNDLDLFGEMRTAALIARLASGDAAAMSAWRCLEMATLGGACALGLGDDIGSIEPGKAADLTAVDLRRAATWPVHDPVAQLVYSACRDQVRDVWVAGRPVLSDGRLQTLDPDAVLERSLEWADRLAGTT